MRPRCHPRYYSASVRRICRLSPHMMEGGCQRRSGVRMALVHRGRCITSAHRGTILGTTAPLAVGILVIAANIAIGRAAAGMDYMRRPLRCRVIVYQVYRSQALMTRHCRLQVFKCCMGPRFVQKIGGDEAVNLGRWWRPETKPSIEVAPVRTVKIRRIP